MVNTVPKKFNLRWKTQSQKISISEGKHSPKNTQSQMVNTAQKILNLRPPAHPRDAVFTFNCMRACVSDNKDVLILLPKDCGQKLERWLHRKLIMHTTKFNNRQPTYIFLINFLFHRELKIPTPQTNQSWFCKAQSKETQKSTWYSHIFKIC